MEITNPSGVKYCKLCGVVKPLNKEGNCTACEEEVQTQCPVCDKVYARYYTDLSERQIAVVPETACPQCVKKALLKNKGYLVACRCCGAQVALSEGDEGVRCPSCDATVVDKTIRVEGEDQLLKKVPCIVCGGRDRALNYDTGVPLCEVCADADVPECYNCGERHAYRGAKGHRAHFRDRYCPQCLAGMPVMAHNYRAHMQLHGQGPLFFGYEHEMDWRGDAKTEKNNQLIRKWAMQSPTEYYLVHDGTLRRGIELVSHPGSFDHWMGKDELVPPIDNQGCSMGTAGGHIHMSRSAFTAAHVVRFASFIADNYSEMCRFFQRKGHEKARCLPDTVPNAFVMGRKGGYERRYGWINFKNPATIEVRAFRAAANTDELRGYIQCLHALHAYTQVPRDEFKKRTWGGFIEFIKSNEKYEDAVCLYSKNVKIKVHAVEVCRQEKIRMYPPELRPRRTLPVKQKRKRVKAVRPNAVAHNAFLEEILNGKYFVDGWDAVKPQQEVRIGD